MISTPNRHGGKRIEAADFKDGRCSYRNSELQYLSHAQVEQVRGPHLSAWHRELYLEGPIEGFLREPGAHCALGGRLAHSRGFCPQKSSQARDWQHQLKPAACRLYGH